MPCSCEVPHRNGATSSRRSRNAGSPSAPSRPPSLFVRSDTGVPRSRAGVGGFQGPVDIPGHGDRQSTIGGSQPGCDPQQEIKARNSGRTIVSAKDRPSGEPAVSAPEGVQATSCRRDADIPDRNPRFPVGARADPPGRFAVDGCRRASGYPPGKPSWRMLASGCLAEGLAADRPPPFRAHIPITHRQRKANFRKFSFQGTRNVSSIMQRLRPAQLP